LRYEDNGNLPSEGQIDIRVQALIGYPEIHSTSDHLDLYNQFAFFSFNGTTSDWSNMQTVNIPDDAVSAYNSQGTTPTPSTTTAPTPTPSTPELPILVILPLFLIMFLITIKLFRKKQPSKNL
jgi:hypothetical protein